MAENFSELVEITNSAGMVTIRLNSTNTARVEIGGSNTAGDLVVHDSSDPPRDVLRFLGEGSGVLRIGTTENEGGLSIRDAENREVLRFHGSSASLSVGTEHNGGDIRVRDASNHTVFNVDSENGGNFRVRDSENREVLHFLSPDAVLRIGAQGNEGDLICRDSAGHESIALSAGHNGVAVLRLGTNESRGMLSIRDAENREVCQFDAKFAAFRVGAAGNEGDIICRDNAGRESIHLSGGQGGPDGHAGLRIGTTDNKGILSIRDAENREVCQFDAEHAVLRIGAAGNEGDIICRDDAGNESIHLNGGKGDIILRNADLAEQFDLTCEVEAPSGTVMSLAVDGRLTPSQSAYDKAVVGVVAGGGRYRSGIVMDHHESPERRRVPVAMVGKVACRVDARYGPVRIGDMLTSSPTHGYAMRASDSTLAFGAVIGKALSSLDEGTGFVDMLISLQ